METGKTISLRVRDGRYTLRKIMVSTTHVMEVSVSELKQLHKEIEEVLGSLDD